MHANIIYARWLYVVAGLWGLLILVPMYFMEAFLSEGNQAGIAHPEYYYGFIGVAVAWQIAFFFIASDPVRYRPIMLAAIFEKFSYGIAVLFLMRDDRIPGGPAFGGIVDLVLGVLFIAAFVTLRRNARYFS
jgi:hypothetical protein